jgi:hypothetical protein
MSFFPKINGENDVAGPKRPALGVFFSLVYYANGPNTDRILYHLFTGTYVFLSVAFFTLLCTNFIIYYT